MKEALTKTQGKETLSFLLRLRLCLLCLASQIFQCEHPCVCACSTSVNQAKLEPSRLKRTRRGQSCVQRGQAPFTSYTEEIIKQEAKTNLRLCSAHFGDVLELRSMRGRCRNSWKLHRHERTDRERTIASEPNRTEPNKCRTERVSNRTSVEPNECRTERVSNRTSVEPNECRTERKNVRQDERTPSHPNQGHTTKL